MNWRGRFAAVAGVVVADDVLRIGPFLIVVEEVLAAQRRDPVGESVEAHAPDADVDVVDAVVADVARAVIAEEAPVTVHAIGVERRLGRGAEPEVVVDVRMAARVGLTCPRSRRFWLFQAFATRTSPIAPSWMRSIASFTVVALRDCVPTWMTTLFALARRRS